jgi:hypothetical protein
VAALGQRAAAAWGPRARRRGGRGLRRRRAEGAGGMGASGATAWSRGQRRRSESEKGRTYQALCTHSLPSAVIWHLTKIFLFLKCTLSSAL